jgi:hypothetical protein
MAARQHYLPDVAFDLTAAALRHLKGAPTQQLLQLAAALAELGHYQAPVVKVGGAGVVECRPSMFNCIVDCRPSYLHR